MNQKRLSLPPRQEARGSTNGRRGGEGPRRGGGSDVGGALSDKTAVEEEKLLTGAGFIRWNLSWIQIKRRYRVKQKKRLTHNMKMMLDTI